MRVAFLTVLTAVLALAAAEDTPELPERESNGVFIVQKNNFDALTKKYKFVLVEFYAPWCGHCKQLEPHYMKAATALLDMDDVALGKVDATIEVDLAQAHEVEGYPTLKWFVTEDAKPEVTTYEGGRTTDEIVAWVKERADPNYVAPLPPPSEVVTLTKDNFSEFVTADISLVEFYAPWCGHCKKIAPELEGAATTLKGEIPIGKVDATLEKELGEQHDIKSYPTLFIYRNGKKSAYKGPRENKGIVDHMREQAGPASKQLESMRQLKEVRDKVPIDIIVVGFFTSETDPLYAQYQELAMEVRDSYPLYHTFDPAFSKALKAPASSITVLLPELTRSPEDPAGFSFVTVGASLEEMTTWLSEHNKVLVTVYTEEVASLRLSKRPLCLGFYEVSFLQNVDNSRYWQHKLATVAAVNKGLTFAVAHDERFAALFAKFGFEESSSDFNLGCIGQDGLHYPMEEMDSWDQDHVEDFVARAKAGALRPHLKSEKAPKKQSGPVTVLVANTFEKTLADTSRDFVIFYHAPWCGHCKKFSPEYTALAKKHAGDKKLSFVKMNADGNTVVPPFKISGFPTIYLRPAGKDKPEPVLYSGDRSLADLEKFIAEKRGSAPPKEEL